MSLSAFEFDIQRSSIGVRVDLIGRKLTRRKPLSELEFDECHRALVEAAEDLKKLRSKAHAIEPKGSA